MVQPVPGVPELTLSFNDVRALLERLTSPGDMPLGHDSGPAVEKLQAFIAAFER